MLAQAERGSVLYALCALLLLSLVRPTSAAAMISSPYEDVKPRDASDTTSSSTVSTSTSTSDGSCTTTFFYNNVSGTATIYSGAPVTSTIYLPCPSNCVLATWNRGFLGPPLLTTVTVSTPSTRTTYMCEPTA